MNERRIASTVLADLELLGEGTSYREEICGMLVNVPLFDDFSPAELRLIASHMHAYRAPPNATLLQEGERGGYLGVVVEGRIGVYKEDGSGHAKQIASITPGKSFGEMSLLDEMPSSAAIVTVADTKLVLISRENFRRMVDDHPALGVRLIWKIARLISLRLRQTSGQLVDYLE